jgi:nitrogen regulatory protein PII
MLIDMDTPLEKTPEDDADVYMVVAYIQPFKVDSVALALAQIDAFRGMTVIECRGSTGDYSVAETRLETESGPPRRRVGERGVVELAARIRLEIVVEGMTNANIISHTIARVAHTGRPGDGLVSAARLSTVLRIRTMQEGTGAV